MSKAIKFRANASEINKTPLKVRYIFIIQDEDGLTVGTTYQTLSRLVGKTILKITVVDVDEDRLTINENPTKEFYEKMLFEWRENYFNPDWDISTI